MSAAAWPPAPEPLPLPVQDDHCHLEMGPLESGRPGPPLAVEEALARAAAVGVDGIVQIGCDLESARWTADLVDRVDRVIGGVALHPTEVARLAAERGRNAVDAAWAEVERLADRPRVRVVGETGLDHYWVEDAEGRAVQEESFRRHIDVAKRMGKVLQIHDRDAHQDVLRVLRSEGAPARTVFHCFSGDTAMARACADEGWLLSFAGTLTFKNAGGLRDALAAVPLDSVLVETDAPFLAPVPVRGRPNASYLVPHTVRCIAEVTGRDLTEVCATLAATFARTYGPFGV